MITIIKSSNKYILFENGQRGTLFVAASTDIPGSVLEYQWTKDGEIKGTAPILDLSNDSDGVQLAGMAGNWNVVVSDGVSEPISLEFLVEEKSQWSAGVGSGDISLPQRNVGTSIPYNPISQINHTLGGFHLYENLDDMLDVEYNYLTLQYGQYAYAKTDKQYIKKDRNIYTTQTVNSFDKVYRFIRTDAKAARDEILNNLNVYNSDLSPLWWRFNARHYEQIEITNPTSAAYAEVVLDSNGYLPIADSNTNTGIILSQQGSGYPNQTNNTLINIPEEDIVSDYFPDTSTTGTTVLLYSDDAIELERINATIVNGKITRLQTTKILGPFTKTPTIVFLTGKFTANQSIDSLKLKWVLNRDWEEKVFLNCVPDNITTTIVNGKLSAYVTAAESLWTDPTPALNVITPTYDMTKLVGHNAIKVLEDVIYPYQNVTINLTAFNNASPVDTLIENGNTITITRVFAEIKNYENLLNNSFVKLSGVYSIPGSNQSITELTTISKDTIVDNNGFVNFTVGIISHPLPINNVEGYSVTLSAGGKEYGENFDGETNTHNVYGQQQIDWAHKIYYFKDSNASITGNLSIPVDAGRTEPTLSPKGVYAYPRTVTPEYVWLFVPSTITLTEIGLPEENIPFYQYATQDGNKFVTTNVNITVGSKQYTYKGYRSYNKTASDVNVTIL